VSLLLGISTSSPALSCALFEDALLASDHRLIGRGHAEAVVPAVAALLSGRRPAAIVVDIGPGSFTGIRVGIAAARALGLAWAVPVTGVSAAALVAAAGFAKAPEAEEITVLLDAGRGQILRQTWTAAFEAGDLQTFAPDAVPIRAGECLAGAGAALLPAGHAGRVILPHEPDMAALLRVPLRLRAGVPAAHYVRPPDALLPL